MVTGVFVFNFQLKKLHVWNTRADIDCTAHEKILRWTGYNVEDCVGGYIDNDKLVFKSTSINEKNFGERNMCNSPLAQ